MGLPSAARPTAQERGLNRCAPGPHPSLTRRTPGSAGARPQLPDVRSESRHTARRWLPRGRRARGQRGYRGGTAARPWRHRPRRDAQGGGLPGIVAGPPGDRGLPPVVHVHGTSGVPREGPVECCTGLHEPARAHPGRDQAGQVEKDIACKRSTHLVGTWFAAESAHQLGVIKQHARDLDRAAAARRTLAARVHRLLEQYGAGAHHVPGHR
ncbi:protein of unknown function [Streptomyces murinus]